MSCILVTGGAGFIGSYLIDSLLKNTDSQIVVIDNFSTGKAENIPASSRITVIQGDITDFEMLDHIFTVYSFNVIFHFAAVASVQDSIENPLYAHRVNFDATLYLLEKAKKLPDFKRFVFPSSAAVYGNNPQLPCKETDAVHPVSPYGSDKYASERYVLNYAQLFAMPTTAFRFFNVYGPRQNPNSPYSGVISIFMKQVQLPVPNFKIFGDGTQTRDFIYIEDLVRAILFTIQKSESIGQVYNLGTGTESSLNKMTQILQKFSKNVITVDYLPKRAGDIYRSCADISLLRQLGFQDTMLTLEDGFSNFFN